MGAVHPGKASERSLSVWRGARHEERRGHQKQKQGHGDGGETDLSQTKENSPKAEGLMWVSTGMHVHVHLLKGV